MFNMKIRGMGKFLLYKNRQNFKGSIPSNSLGKAKYGTYARTKTESNLKYACGIFTTDSPKRIPNWAPSTTEWCLPRPKSTIRTGSIILLDILFHLKPISNNNGSEILYIIENEINLSRNLKRFLKHNLSCSITIIFMSWSTVERVVWCKLYIFARIVTRSFRVSLKPSNPIFFHIFWTYQVESWLFSSDIFFTAH